MNKYDDKSLKIYQDKLANLLASGTSVEQIIAELKEDPDLESLRDYIDEFEPDMLAVAKELFEKWGVKSHS